ncbi:MAG TPA: AMP-binding protein, partial [Polyangia bacterium]|nr:AMP-binding protein [Polyangia bacterium]
MLIFVLTFLVWRWYRGATIAAVMDIFSFGLTDCFGERSLVSVPHQKGVRWLTEVFSRSAARFPDLTALQVPRTGESLTFAELERRAEEVAAAVAPFLTGPDQVVAVAMSQDNWQIVAAHLGVLKAGGTFMCLDAALPDPLISHMLQDARPVVVLTQGADQFRGLPTLNVMALPERKSPRVAPHWLDDPTQRLAAIFYTSGTTGMPKGVECPHAGYVNLA